MMNSVQNNHRWFDETKLTRFEQFLINIIKCGQIPKHIAIIMDGNRRYAKKVHLDQANCYNLGFEKIKNILKYSHHLGVDEITIFAFSIENFKRDQSETDLVFNLAIEKFTALLNEKDEIIKNDVCIRFIGNLSLLPIKLRNLASELMLLTKDHKSKCLNVCIAYTSSYELSAAAIKLYNAHNQNVLINEQISKEDLNTCLLTNKSQTDPDLLIRTSGEIRLSDFLLWQCNYSVLSFTSCLWPECNFYEFWKLILKYQLDNLFNSNERLNKMIKSNKLSINSDLSKYLDCELEKTLNESKSTFN